MPSVPSDTESGRAPSAEPRRWGRWGAALAVALVITACGPSRPDASTSTSQPEPAFKYTVAGDSISLGFGAALRTRTGENVVVKNIGEEGTGLARPDRFNWPERLDRLARDFAPTVLVFAVGSNDAQDLTGADGKVVARTADPRTWEAEYARRLGSVFDAFSRTSTRVLWLGPVRTSDDRVGLTNRRIHQLALQEAARRPWVSTADLAELLGTGEQPATRCLRDDGLHLTNACLDEAAQALVPRLATLR